MKKNIKTIIGLFIAFIIGISTTVGAVTIFNSQDIKYSSDKTEATNVKDSLDELYSKVNNAGQCSSGYHCLTGNFANIIKVGDYINMTPTSTSYTLPNELSGCTGNTSTCVQNTINPSKLNLWRVIRKNEDKTIEMVSEYTSERVIYFYGITGYKNFVGSLNTIASQYTDGVHVQSTRHFGYTDQTEFLSDSNKFTTTSRPWSKPTERFINMSSDCDQNQYLCGLYEKEGAGDIGEWSDCELVENVYGTIKGTSIDGGIKGDYWISSRGYQTSEEGQYQLNLKYTYSGEVSTHMVVNSGVDYTSINWAAIRPIVTLKSDCVISSGNGTFESPYTLK